MVINPMELAQLKDLILTSEPEDFVSNNILTGGCAHFSLGQIEYVRQSISEATGIEIAQDEIYVVGSAKLGYGLFEKKKSGGIVLPAFRKFDPLSDIDIAFASSRLFDLVWDELSSFAVSQPWMPHRMNKLGDYLVYGWLRPDHFPKEARLHNYDRWNDRVRKLGADRHLERRKISGALYRNVDFIRKYQARGINACKQLLETP